MVLFLRQGKPCHALGDCCFRVIFSVILGQDPETSDWNSEELVVLCKDWGWVGLAVLYLVLVGQQVL